MAEILIVDDEIGVRELLTEVLQDEGHSITLASNGAEAREARKNLKPDLVLLDIWMPDTDGITLLKEWMSSDYKAPVVVMSGHATIDTAVEATRIGAYDYLEKPITLSKLLKTINNATLKRLPDFESKKLLNEKISRPKDILLNKKKPDSSKVLTNYSQKNNVESNKKIQPLQDDELSKEVIALNEAREALSKIDLDLPLREARDSFERIYLSYQLAKLQGSMTRLAQRSGLERTHLYRKIRQLGMELQRGIFKKTQ